MNHERAAAFEASLAKKLTKCPDLCLETNQEGAIDPVLHCPATDQLRETSPRVSRLGHAADHAACRVPIKCLNLQSPSPFHFLPDPEEDAAAVAMEATLLPWQL